MSNYPQDRFDKAESVTGRSGSHRRPVRRLPWWVTALSVLGSSGVIIVVALAGITVIDARLNFQIPSFGPTQTPTPTPTPTPTFLDPTTLTERQFAAVTLTILNGTTSPTLPADVAAILTSQNWPQPTIADASETTVKESVIVYRYPADQLLAESIANALGIELIQKSELYRGARVYVVLGADFVK